MRYGFEDDADNQRNRSSAETTAPSEPRNIQRSLEVLQPVLEIIPEAITILSKEGAMLMANKTFYYELLGYDSLRELQQVKLAKWCVKPSEINEWFPTHKKTKQRSRFSGKLKTKDDIVCDVEVSSTALEFWGHPLCVAIIHDFTTQQQVVEARKRYMWILRQRVAEINLLQEVNNLLEERKSIPFVLTMFCTRMQAIYDHIFIDLALLQRDGTVTYVFSSLFLDKSFPHPNQLLGLQTTGDKILTLYELNEVMLINNPEKVTNFIKNLLPEMAFVPEVLKTVGITSAILAPIRVQNQLQGILSISSVRNLTNEDYNTFKHLINQLILAIERVTLTMELERSNQALADHNKKLTELDRMKSSFIAMASHELRTPLTAIKGYAELARDGKLGPLQLEEAFEVILRNADRLERLANDVHDQAKIDADKFSIQMAPLDIGVLARESVQTMHPVLQARHHEVGLKISETLPQIQGDAHRLTQVFRNLLENAAKFTPEGGKIELRIRELPTSILIEIQDTGIGIGPENIERVFDQFVSLERSDSVSGSGLGLSIAREIVIRHGGWIWAESDGEDRGTTVFFTLPK